MKKNSERTPYIADIHTHVLPKVDDGSSSMEESLEMLKIAEQEGITHLICTPHQKYGGRTGRSAAFKSLTEEAAKAGSKIKLYLGAEVLYFRDLEQAVTEGKVFSINKGEYMLVEFHPQDSYVKIRNGLDDVFSLGYTPILAHAERYNCIVKQFARVEDLRGMGVKIQVNASSVTGSLGWGIKRFVHKLLKKQYVDYVATDAHNSEKRAPRIQKCKDFLYRKYDTEYVNDILFENANRDFGFIEE